MKACFIDTLLFAYCAGKISFFADIPTYLELVSPNIAAVYAFCSRENSSVVCVVVKGWPLNHYIFINTLTAGANAILTHGIPGNGGFPVVSGGGIT